MYRLGADLGGVTLQLGPVSGAPNDTKLISRANGATGVKGNSASSDAAISANGRFVAFATTSTNLGDTDGFQDVFVRDRVANTTKLVSRGPGATGVNPNGDSRAPSISADGRFVAFFSDATNLPGDTDGSFDIFVRDVVSNTTTLLSRANGVSGASANSNSYDPSISADGRHVAFVSVATNLPSDTDSASDIFVRDVQAATTALVSRASGPSGAKQDGDSLEPSISGDGSRVAFTSTAVNLPDDNDVDADVFVRDVKANTTTLASREDGDGNASANATAHFGEISSDGNAVAFSSSATNLPDAGDAVDDIFVRFLSSNSTVLVSRASGGTGVRGNGNSTFSSISSDGQFVAFDSASTNLVTPDDTDVFSDIYVRDVFDALTTLVSRESGATGARGDLPSSSPSISDDGGFTAFQSSATNFDPVADGNSDTDIYVRELEVPPSIALVPGGSCTGTTSGTMNMFVNDANTGTTGLTLSALSTNDAVVDPDTDVTFGGSGTNRTLTIAPSGFGSADLIVSVTTPDDTGDYFELLVDSGDDSPDGVNISGDMSSMVLSRGGADQVNTGDGIDLVCPAPSATRKSIPAAATTPSTAARTQMCSTARMAMTSSAAVTVETRSSATPTTTPWKAGADPTRCSAASTTTS